MKVLFDTSVLVAGRMEEMAEHGLSGGVVYDALIAGVARKLAVDRLLTLNAHDFLRIWPEGKAVITNP
jgi:hypothetical protein